jgi:hypothetical protein
MDLRDPAHRLQMIRAFAYGILASLDALPADLADDRVEWADQLRIERILIEIRKAAQAIVEHAQ